MTLAMTAEPVPVAADPDGSLRVAGTRVLLDTVIGAFQQGASPEQIVDQYPSLNLAQAYAVIAFYLRHTSEVDAYLAQRKQEAEQLRLQVETKYGQTGIRERLTARMNTFQNK